MTAQETTRFRTNYGTETLVFGADYVFGVSGPQGRDDAVSGRLESRAANGDLVVLVDSSGTTKRVRPSKILSVYGTGEDFSTDASPLVPDRFPNETESSYLRRLEEHFGSRYEAFIESPTGQELLRRVAVEDRASRKGAKLVALPDPEPDPKVRSISSARSSRNGHEPPTLRAIETPEDFATVEAKTEEIVRTAEATKTPKGRPYAERNQVWKCGTCKRRTRQPVCVGQAGAEHPRVEAPAGKRRDDR